MRDFYSIYFQKVEEVYDEVMKAEDVVRKKLDSVKGKQGRKEEERFWMNLMQQKVKNVVSKITARYEQCKTVNVESTSKQSASTQRKAQKNAKKHIRLQHNADKLKTLADEASKKRVKKRPSTTLGHTGNIDIMIRSMPPKKKSYNLYKRSVPSSMYPIEVPKRESCLIPQPPYQL
jgi:predicted metal-dependent hydrolase